MTGEETNVRDGDRQVREAALARDLDVLRLGLQADPPLMPDEIRRRIDAIADEMLALDGQACEP